MKIKLTEKVKGYRQYLKDRLTDKDADLAATESFEEWLESEEEDMQTFYVVSAFNIKTFRAGCMADAQELYDADTKNDFNQSMLLDCEEFAKLKQVIGCML